MNTLFGIVFLVALAICAAAIIIIGSEDGSG